MDFWSLIPLEPETSGDGGAEPPETVFNRALAGIHSVTCHTVDGISKGQSFLADGDGAGVDVNLREPWKAERTRARNLPRTRSPNIPFRVPVLILVHAVLIGGDKQAVADREVRNFCVLLQYHKASAAPILEP